MDSNPCHVVLGATGGIGSELCRQLCASGAHVVAASRNSDKVRELAENIGVTPFTLDATDIEQVAACLAETEQTFGRVDGVANCVGSLLLKPAHSTSVAEWQTTLAINLTSAFAAVRAGAKAMLRRGGSIVLVSSAAARVGLANHEAIAAAKAGIIGLTLSAAASYADRGIRINCVAPGLVRTPLTARLTANEASLKASTAMHPLDRIGEASDVAARSQAELDHGTSVGNRRRPGDSANSGQDMKLERFIFRSPMPASADSVFAWHCRPGAFVRLSPPWEPVKMFERTGGVADEGRVVLAVRAMGFWRRWTAEHCDYEPGRQFCDLQIEGSFAYWRHCHRVSPDGSDRSYLEDDIEYALPYGSVGALFGRALVRRKLERMFRYRHRLTAGDPRLHQKYPQGHSMKIAITGSTGLVGSVLVPFLTTGGHHVTRIVRSGTTQSDAVWNPATGKIDANRLEGLDAVVHLAGENIASGAGTRSKRLAFATAASRGQNSSAKLW